jgi:hypothetical protein
MHNVSIEENCVIKSAYHQRDASAQGSRNFATALFDQQCGHIINAQPFVNASLQLSRHVISPKPAET